MKNYCSTCSVHSVPFRSVPGFTITHILEQMRSGGWVDYWSVKVMLAGKGCFQEKFTWNLLTALISSWCYIWCCILTSTHMM